MCTACSSGCSQKLRAANGLRNLFVKTTMRKELQMNDEIVAENKELVGRFYKEVYVDWNMAVVDEVVSPQFTSHDWPKGSPTGPQAFRDYYDDLRLTVPDARYEVDDLIAERDRVVVRWRLLGTHKGAFRGIAPTGRA